MLLVLDSETVLQEESIKKPCRKFHFEGFCPFGGTCTFSHYSREDLELIRQELNLKKARQAEEPTVEAWLVKYNQQLEAKKQESRDLLWSNKLPPELAINAALLPPSLLPFCIQDFINADLEAWG